MGVQSKREWDDLENVILIPKTSFWGAGAFHRSFAKQKSDQNWSLICMRFGAVRCSR